ncbi:hypothetical protein SOVF_109150 [Spinacia oleracea]|nr:hypothetical protein SOVF_109150 [Spinacia oleracea]
MFNSPPRPSPWLSSAASPAAPSSTNQCITRTIEEHYKKHPTIKGTTQLKPLTANLHTLSYYIDY